jgi:hypothetical protein
MSKNVNFGSRLISFIVEHRKMVLALSLILLFVTILAFGGVEDEKKANASTVKEKYFTCIDIQEGDTLWSIAEEYAGVEFDSKQAFIKEVERINELKGDRITSGATLVIPIYK